jgi:hypothetical protein
MIAIVKQSIKIILIIIEHWAKQREPELRTQLATFEVEIGRCE